MFEQRPKKERKSVTIATERNEVYVFGTETASITNSHAHVTAALTPTSATTASFTPVPTPLTLKDVPQRCAHLFSLIAKPANAPEFEHHDRKKTIENTINDLKAKIATISNEAERKTVKEAVQSYLGQNSNYPTAIDDGNPQETLLHLAFRKNESDTAMLLIESFGAFDTANSIGYTPVMLIRKLARAEYAAEKLICTITYPEWNEVLSKLVEMEINLGIQHFYARNGGTSLRSCTPLAYACADNDVARVKILLSSPKGKMAVNIVNSYGAHGSDSYTALQLVCNLPPSSNRLKIAKLLVKAGAFLNFQEKNHQFSALMYACNANNPVMVKMLMAHGADVTLKNAHETTALGLVLKNGDEYLPVASLLLASEGKQGLGRSLEALERFLKKVSTKVQEKSSAEYNFCMGILYDYLDPPKARDFYERAQDKLPILGRWFGAKYKAKGRFFQAINCYSKAVYLGDIKSRIPLVKLLAHMEKYPSNVKENCAILEKAIGVITPYIPELADVADFTPPERDFLYRRKGEYLEEKSKEKPSSKQKVDVTAIKDQVDRLVAPHLDLSFKTNTNKPTWTNVVILLRRLWEYDTDIFFQDSSIRDEILPLMYTHFHMMEMEKYFQKLKTKDFLFLLNYEVSRLCFKGEHLKRACILANVAKHVDVAKMNPEEKRRLASVKLSGLRGMFGGAEGQVPAAIRAHFVDKARDITAQYLGNAEAVEPKPEEATRFMFS